MNKKKRSIVLYILIVVAIMLLLSVGGYFIYRVFQISKNPSVAPSLFSKFIASNDSSSKIDNSKDWVYDAEYPKDIQTDSYSTENDTYYSKDIIVPYININSSYARSANDKIKEIFDEAIRNYNLGAIDKVTYVDECSYKAHFDNNHLSIVLSYITGSTDIVRPNYYTFNIDLTNGNQLPYEAIYSLAGFDASNINSSVENAIENVLKEKISDLSSENYHNNIDFETFNAESIYNYKQSLANSTLKYFLSDDGKLNIVVTLKVPTATGQLDVIVTVDE